MQHEQCGEHARTFVVGEITMLLRICLANMLACTCAWVKLFIFA